MKSLVAWMVYSAADRVSEVLNVWIFVVIVPLSVLKMLGDWLIVT